MSIKKISKRNELEKKFPSTPVIQTPEQIEENWKWAEEFQRKKSIPNDTIYSTTPNLTKYTSYEKPYQRFPF